MVLRTYFAASNKEVSVENVFTLFLLLGTMKVFLTNIFPDGCGWLPAHLLLCSVIQYLGSDTVPRPPPVAAGVKGVVCV